MPHTLSVTVHVELDLREVELAVSGCLTAETHVSLLRVVTQARGLDPAPRITLDLLGTEHIDPDGLSPLQRLIDLDPHRGNVPVEYRIPDPLPTCTRTVKSPQVGWAGAASLAPPRHERERAGGAALTAPQPADTSSATAVQAPSAPAAPGARPRTRREEILEGAAEMFAEHGYYGASLRDISKHIGISHPGLMHHFASKDALLDAVIDRLEAHAQRALDQTADMSTDPEALMRSLAAHWHPASFPVQLLTTLGTESVSGDHPGRFRLARLRRVHEHVLEQCFAALAEQGRLRRGLDPAFASRAMLGLVLTLAVREKTVRMMQHDQYDDAPIRELARLARTFLGADAQP